eukprot:1458439-Pyramimonas_sp.AAC.1
MKTQAHFKLPTAPKVRPALPTALASEPLPFGVFPVVSRVQPSFAPSDSLVNPQTSTAFPPRASSGPACLPQLVPAPSIYLLARRDWLPLGICPPQWDAEEYFTPALENDALLFGFEEEEDFEGDDAAEVEAAAAAACAQRGDLPPPSSSGHIPGGRIIAEEADPSTALAELQSRTRYLLAQVTYRP